MSSSHISSTTDKNALGTTRTVSFTHDGRNQLTDISPNTSSGFFQGPQRSALRVEQVKLADVTSRSRGTDEAREGPALTPPATVTLLVMARVLIAIQAPPFVLFALVAAFVGWGTARTEAALHGAELFGTLLIIASIVVPLWSFLSSFMRERWALLLLVGLQAGTIAGALTWVANTQSPDAAPVGVFALVPFAVIGLVLIPSPVRHYFHW